MIIRNHVVDRIPSRSKYGLCTLILSTSYRLVGDFKDIVFLSPTLALGSLETANQRGTSYTYAPLSPMKPH